MLVLKMEQSRYTGSIYQGNEIVLEQRNTFFQIPGAILGIVLITLLIKIILLDLNAGEYTDGIIQLQLWESPVIFFPPGYSAVVWGMDFFVQNLLLSGRLVSVLASVLALIFFYKLSLGVLGNEKQAVLATLFLALSPIFNRWSLRVMTDSLFCLLFIICCDECMRVIRNQRRSILLLMFYTGLAVLIRYQGLFFVPFIAFFIWKNRSFYRKSNVDSQQDISPTRRFSLGWLLLSLIPWILLGGWILYRGFGHTGQFVERAFYGLGVYFYCFEGFIFYWPWAVTYPLFILGIVGGYYLYKGNGKEKRFLSFVGIAIAVFVTVQTLFLSFQFRYLLPILPLWCIGAARGFAVLHEKILQRVWQIGLSVLVILPLCIMTISVLFLQRETFGDLVDSAKYLREIGKGARVLSDEVYGHSDHNVKMRFWSGRKIFLFPAVQPEEGDILVLHNAYSDLNAVYEYLNRNYEYVVLRQWNSMTSPGRYITIPLLPDIMVEPHPLRLTSNPACMAFRFTPQRYVSVALRITGRKGDVG